MCMICEAMNKHLIEQEGIIGTPKDKYTASCIICQSQAELSMHPIRKGGVLGGWVFVCQKHVESLKGMSWFTTKDLEKIIKLMH